MRWNQTASFIDGGWVPYNLRNTQQRKLTDEFHERIGAFRLVGSMGSDSPERVVFAEAQHDVLGELLPKVNQLTGSCVGSGAANAYMDAMLGDIVHRGENETVKMIFPFATYGKGREIGGMRRKGEGSFGGAQAKACQPDHFGYLAWDDPRVPKPSSTKDGWWKWTSGQEMQWSFPSGWPVSERELFTDAKQFGITAVTRIRSADELEAAIDQGFGVTVACMFGTEPRVEGDVLLGRWNKQWAHQQSIDGKWRHPQHGRIFKIQNQWNDMHGHCPTLHGEWGCTGTYWMLDKDADKICRNDEVYAHSSTGGFEAREFKWTKTATYTD